MKRPVSLLIASLLIFSVTVSAQKGDHEIRIPFADSPVPTAPDYSDADNWAALPTKQDNADLIPKGAKISDDQATAEADVFYIHPTVFLQGENWNADVKDAHVNDRTDNLPLKFQASIFNGSGKVYAPRYRQAHIRAFFHYEEGGNEALKIAYSDVRRAFQYYLEHHNNGRPIVIASHSQGTVHACFLMREFFDGKPLADQLVAAYLVGMPVRDTVLKETPLCTTPDQTSCYVSWGTFARDYLPDAGRLAWQKGAQMVNPISWTTEPGIVSHKENKGFVGRRFSLRPKTFDAEINEEHCLLWTGKPHIPLGKMLGMKDFHIADYNLYWMDVRENVALRVEKFLEASSTSSK